MTMEKIVIASNAMNYIRHQLQAGISGEQTDAAAKKTDCECCSQLKGLLRDFSESGEISGDDLSKIGILLSH